ncbi:hypothetical protein CA54_19510 [Symmachiella macrocystis]|uniref:Uncharacterized protein n=1 Tax=Symmachiella macrocystis TaxID=2527985 RepID=A0A5C6BM88_9PLAN|nr:hypothetical protein CA54_19510 [Symmachiella macrocystis]
MRFASGGSLTFWTRKYPSSRFDRLDHRPARIGRDHFGRQKVFACEGAFARTAGDDEDTRGSLETVLCVICRATVRGKVETIYRWNEPGF